MQAWRIQEAEKLARYHDGYSSLANGETNRKRRNATFEGDTKRRFVAFDGEGSYGRYQLLAISASDRVLVSQRGLGTADCLGYFASLFEEGAVDEHDAFIGFGLGYDFENILRDLPDDDYVRLRHGERVRFIDYTLRYVPRKYLDVQWGLRDVGRDRLRGYSIRLQDVYPYFQQSFVKACESRAIELPDVIYEGKRNRGAFRFRDIDRIIEYNRAELVAMVRLAETLRDDFVAAFDALRITPNIGKRAWYGPGSQAISVLDVANTKQLTIRSRELSYQVVQTLGDHYASFDRGPKPDDSMRRAYLSSMLHPFTAAYFGGRIEAAMQGRLKGPLYDYDLTSAYPYAITRLPDLTGKDVIRVEAIDPRRRIGIYLVRWEGTARYAYHPFPYRAKNGNVYFPRQGIGWVLSPELYLASDPRYGQRIEVIHGFVLDRTDGYGSGREAGGSDLANLMMAMGEHRAQAKRDGNPAHRGLKLLMNSVYGKTLQKEGSRKFFNAFLAAWITSVTRSRIYELIGLTMPGEVVSVMTDGVLSTVPLEVAIGEDLGAWTLTTYQSGYQFAPGVYTLRRESEDDLVRYRGFLRFDAEAAKKAVDEGVDYISSNPVFVSRTMAMHDHSLRKRRYQFVPIKRVERFSLASKRDMDRPERFGDATYYPPKSSWENLSLVSWPYDAFGDSVKEEDEARKRSKAFGKRDGK